MIEMKTPTGKKAMSPGAGSHRSMSTTTPVIRILPYLTGRLCFDRRLPNVKSIFLVVISLHDPREMHSELIEVVPELNSFGT